MIRLETLSIRKFKGIKELTIPFGGKSWVIHGRNGSGKSGVVDAIEFALSGEISRLSGEGRGGLSVKEHGPHVDYKNSPQEAEVTLAVKFDKKDAATITRNCETPNKFKMEPKKHQANLIQAGSEIVLSRREILKFILTEPGKRSKEVQALLRVDKLEEVRAALQTLKNKVSKNFAFEAQELKGVKGRLTEWLEIEELSKEKVLTVVNKYREVLGLVALAEISKETKLTEGLLSDTKSNQYLSKTELLKTVDSIGNTLMDAQKTFCNDAQAYLDLLEEISGKEKQIQSLSRLSFLESGVKLIDGDECPLCETDWNQEELKAIVQAKITEVSGVKKTQTEIENQIHKVIAHWKLFGRDLDFYCEKTRQAANLRSEQIEALRATVNKLIKNENTGLDRIKTTIVDNKILGILADGGPIQEHLAYLKDQLASFPEKSDKEKSKEFLIVCQERIDNFRTTARKYDYQKKKAELVGKLLDKYNEVSETYLNELYNQVEDDFSKFYQIVNQDDEAFCKKAS